MSALKKAMVFLAVLFLALPGWGQAEKGITPPELLLAPQKAGKLTLGMSIDEVYRLFGRESTRPEDLYSEGHFTPVLQIFLEPNRHEPGLELGIGWEKGWVAVSIMVYDPRFRTEKGIGVGSTLGELRKFYRVKSIYLVEGHLLASVEELQMSFELKLPRFPLEFVETRDPKLIPDTAKIIAVQLSRERGN